MCTAFRESQSVHQAMVGRFTRTIIRNPFQHGLCGGYRDADVHVDRDGAPSWEGVNAGNAKIGAAQDSLAGVGDSAFYGPRDRLYLMKSGAFISVEAGFDDSVRVRGKRVAQLIASKL
jgi:hypothetical protein